MLIDKSGYVIHPYTAASIPTSRHAVRMYIHAGSELSSCPPFVLFFNILNAFFSLPLSDDDQCLLFFR